MSSCGACSLLALRLHHVVELFVLVEFAFLFGGGILVLLLLVLRYEVIHVGLGLSELHLVHSFAGVYQ
jgi:hypothetical protein